MKRTKISGIYTITNLANGKIYVGRATNFMSRKSTHFSQLNSKTHGNEHLTRAYEKYGKENFSLELIDEYPLEFLDAMECYWINMLNTTNKDFGYNIRKPNPDGFSKLSEETKKKIGDAHRGKIVSEKAKKQMSESHTGVPLYYKRRPVVSLETGEIFSYAGDLCDILNMSVGRIYSHLNLGVDIGYKYCDSPNPTKELRKTKVEYLPTGEIFETMSEASKKLGINMKTISFQLSKNSSTNMFRYVNKISKEEKKIYRKKIIHIETGLIFDSIREGAKYLGIPESNEYGRLRRNVSKHFKYLDEI